MSISFVWLYMFKCDVYAQILAGNLQTYELGLSRIGNLSKNKSMALKAKSNDTDEFSDDKDSKMKSYITR